MQAWFELARERVVAVAIEIVIVPDIKSRSEIWGPAGDELRAENPARCYYFSVMSVCAQRRYEIRLRVIFLECLIELSFFWVSPKNHRRVAAIFGKARQIAFYIN